MRLGIDIGGTKTAVAVVTDTGVVEAVRTAPSGRGPVGVLEVAVGLSRAVAADVGGQGRISSVGACMPGVVDPASGWARHAVNLGVEAVDLAGELGRALGRPVLVENDVKAAALGACRLLDLSPVGTVAYLNLGTGLASAVVHEGVVVRGIGGAAGEIGHLPIGGDAPCACGQVGCLETVASGSALARLWPAEARRLADPFAAAAVGDHSAAVAVDVLCEGIGLAVQLLALAAGAERVVLGGGLVSLGEPLRDGVRRGLERRARSSRVVDSLGLPDRFELLPSTVPVGALGAAWLAAAPDVAQAG